MKVATIVGVLARKSQFIITISDGLYGVVILEDGLTLIERWAFRLVVKDVLLDKGYTTGSYVALIKDDSRFYWCVSILLSSNNAMRGLSPCHVVSLRTTARHQKVSDVFQRAGTYLPLPALLLSDIASDIGNSVKSSWRKPNSLSLPEMATIVGDGK